MSERPSPEQLIQTLRGVDLFSAADDGMLRQMADQAHWRHYEAAETVFWEGEPAAGLYLLHSGWLKVVKSAPSGREQTIKFLGPGEIFNEIGALADQANPATAITLEAAEIWLIRRSLMLDLLAGQPEFARHVIESLANRVMHLVDLIADLSLRSVTQRLARLLLESTSDDVLHRPRWYTQAELAGRLGTVPDVIQRALRELVNDELISVERQRIDILDRAALERIASS